MKPWPVYGYVKQYAGQVFEVFLIFYIFADFRTFFSHESTHRNARNKLQRKAEFFGAREIPISRYTVYLTKPVDSAFGTHRTAPFG